MKALLFSGGIDSTAIANWLRPDLLVLIDYGQIAFQGEQRAANLIAHELQLPITTCKVDARSIGSGDLAGLGSLNENASEFWPFRNQLLITVAAMRLAASSPLQILIGTVATDGIHPDGNPEFLAAANLLLGSQGAYSLEAPAQHLTSIDLVRASQAPASLLHWCFSCHRNVYACGQCRGCRKHHDILKQI